MKERKTVKQKIWNPLDIDKNIPNVFLNEHTDIWF